MRQTTGYRPAVLGIVPRPLQQPHPPVYAPFSYSMETSKFWAREGGKMVSFVAPERQSFIGTALDIYLEEAHNSGRDTTAADALAIGGHLTMGRVWRGSREEELDHVASPHEEFGVTEFFLRHHVGCFTQDQDLAMLNEFAEGVIAPLRASS